MMNKIQISSKPRQQSGFGRDAKDWQRYRRCVAAPIQGDGTFLDIGCASGLLMEDVVRWAKEDGKDVILVRPETRPDDVHGMLAAKGVVTSKGGRTSHAALVARQFGKPAVVGVEEIEIDLDKHLMRIGEDLVIEEGACLSIDGNHGLVYQDKLPTVVPDIRNPYLLKILSWADAIRKLGVRANADYPEDAQRAREYGAEGIGLCRTEHMFFQEERLQIMQRMILANTTAEQAEAIALLMPMQRSDFEGLFRAMDGLPVIIRLLDPPLHEFLPSAHDLLMELSIPEMRVNGVIGLMTEEGYFAGEMLDGTVIAGRDNLSFIPEPSSLLLTLAGLMALTLYRRK